MSKDSVIRADQLTAMDLHVLSKIGLDQESFITFRTFVIYIFVSIPMNIQLLLVNEALTAFNAFIPSIICKERKKNENNKKLHTHTHMLNLDKINAQFQNYFDAFACVSSKSCLLYTLCRSIGTEIFVHLHVPFGDTLNEPP